ncbi:MAG: hypothetical protein ACI943_002814, partial [Gammaproteobacteria bacterium]
LKRGPNPYGRKQFGEVEIYQSANMDEDPAGIVVIL